MYIYYIFTSLFYGISTYLMNTQSIKTIYPTPMPLTEYVKHWLDTSDNKRELQSVSTLLNVPLRKCISLFRNLILTEVNTDQGIIWVEQRDESGMFEYADYLPIDITVNDFILRAQKNEWDLKIDSSYAL